MLFTFTDIKHLSNQAANAFKELGIGKGDVVMCILRRRWEYWVCAVALCKLGATIIPASLQLTRKDVVYRANSADVKAIVAVNDEYVCTQVEEAMPDCPTVREKFIVDGSREGWVDFDELIAGYPDTFERPTASAGVTSKDIMLMYFTSGTTGNPKAVEHNFAHPLGHIITAKYWQQVQENKLHMSVTDSGWAKFGWGKIYGQWIAGATIFAYDMDKFVPTKLLQKIQDYKLTTFCAPPTMYRFMLQEDVAAYDSVQRGELRHGRRAAERGGDHSMGAPHRQEDPRGLRPDRGPGASGHLPVDRAEARLHGQAVAPAQREAARRRRPRGR